MKKTIKIVLVFLVCVFALLPQNIIYASETVIPYTTEKNSNIEPRAIGDLTLTIFAAINTKGSSSGVSGLGNSHAWIVIKNTGAGKTVGNYSLANNGCVSLGTWGNTSPLGIWYNLERKKINEFQNNSNTVYKEMNITSSDLTKVNTVIKNSNNWSLTNNCTHFVTKVWNAAGGNFSSSMTPDVLRTKIINTGYYNTGTSSADFQSCSTSARKY